jgi:hypothetical protein
MSELRSTIREIAGALRHIKTMLDVCEAGPERDQMQGQYDRTYERFKTMPKRIADQGPFKTDEELIAAVTRECAFVIAAIDGTN